LEGRAKELDAQGLHDAANELRRQMQSLSPAKVCTLLALPEPAANGTAQPALPEPKRAGRPRKEEQPS
jgi:hypothetical protein